MLTGSLSVTTGLSSRPQAARVHPGAGGFSKVADEPALILRGQLPNGFQCPAAPAFRPPRGHMPLILRTCSGQIVLCRSSS